MSAKYSINFSSRVRISWIKWESDSYKTLKETKWKQTNYQRHDRRNDQIANKHHRREPKQKHRTLQQAAKEWPTNNKRPTEELLKNDQTNAKGRLLENTRMAKKLQKNKPRTTNVRPERDHQAAEGWPRYRQITTWAMITRVPTNRFIFNIETTRRLPRKQAATAKNNKFIPSRGRLLLTTTTTYAVLPAT